MTERYSLQGRRNTQKPMLAQIHEPETYYTTSTGCIRRN